MGVFLEGMVSRIGKMAGYLSFLCALFVFIACVHAHDFR